MHGQCRFRDDDLSAGNYRELHIIKCLLTEHGLRRILEEVLDCRRDIVSYDFTLQKVIDVDRLLDGLPNIERIDEDCWNLRNSRDQIMELHIENNYFSCYTTAI
uniref:Leucine-rich repeat domain-containing protein n=1 Tax=Heterorhabditis bacteriophora TaxID=37862 RepID=A0A1I7XCR4_HETBA